MSRVSFYTRPYDRLEPYDGKLSRTVLRGGAGSNASLLPDIRSEKDILKLEYAANTKIIRFKKITAEANPFDKKWTGYYEERDGERMLNSTKGREKLVKIWNNQKRCCPVCGERITSETGFKTHFITENNRKWPAIMVHPWCHRNLHEPDYLI